MTSVLSSLALTPEAPVLEQASTLVHSWRHQLSHRDLVSPLSGFDIDQAALPGATVKFAVVPTSRPDSHLRSGVNTALDLAQMGMITNMLFIVSKAAADAHSMECLRKRISDLPFSVNSWVTVLPDDTRLVPGFKVDRLPLSSANRRYADGGPVAKYSNDVGTKRNLALLAAMNLGFDHLLFLDDDISPARPGTVTGRPTLDTHSLRQAVVALRAAGGPSAVGWELRGYDDNSVVCRAAALAGLKQHQFIGAGALLVRIDHSTPFFPAIYNEDWLFLLGMLRADRLPRAAWADAGDVLQDPYDGYRPQRARSEELGDILAEGLMSLLSADSSALHGADNRGFWRAVIVGRRALILEVRRRLLELHDPASSQTVGRALVALDVALKVHAGIEARSASWLDQFTSYMQAWRSDLDLWASTVKRANQLPLDRLMPGRPARWRKGRMG